MKTALVTGTTSGVGLALSQFLTEKGWKVIGFARSPAVFMHTNYQHEQIDITSKQDLEIFFKLNSGLKLDLLVHNAAVFVMREFETCELASIDSIIDTNLKAPMYITSLALPLLELGSRIVFINSVAGLEELESQSIYCASKSGLTAFAGVLGKEIQRKNIRVSSIHPGGIDTPLWNENNPYPCGSTSMALTTKDICDTLNLILTSKHTLKTIKLFPNIEWH